MKFKTLEELNQFIASKRGQNYKTILSSSLTLDEIDILRDKPSTVTLGRLYDITTKAENRISSLVELFAEIEDIRYAGWSYSESEHGSEEIKFLYGEDRFMIYPYTEQWRNVMSEVFEYWFPVGYLFLEKDVLVTKYLNEIHGHYTKIFDDAKKQSEKRQSAKVKYMQTLKSIKSKVTLDEFKFVVNKCRLTKKEKKELLG